MLKYRTPQSRTIIVKRICHGNYGVKILKSIRCTCTMRDFIIIECNDDILCIEKNAI